MIPTKINQNLIKKYNQTTKSKYGIEFKVRNQAEFNRLRALAILAEVLNFDEFHELKTFTRDIHKDYYLKQPILDKWGDGVYDTTMADMDYKKWWEQDIWALWYMYSYNAVMNYSYNADNPKYETIFENNMKMAVNKMMAILSNRAIEQVRTEMVELLNKMVNNPPTRKERVLYKDEETGKEEEREVKLTMHLQFMWKTREDEKVCKTCAGLNGQMLYSIPEQMPHPNCRCDFIVYEWWTDPEGRVIADRRYEIEQNKKYKSDGFAIKTAKVTSKLVDGEQVTIFEVEDEDEEGKTHKVTFKTEDLDNLRKE